MTDRRSRPTVVAALASAVLAAAALACESAPAGAVTQCQTSSIVPAVPKTDILFVVDDSGSMAAEQQLLATAFGGFIDALSKLPVKDAFQIGITTTSVDDTISDGAGGYILVTKYASGTPYPRGALVSAAGRPRLLDAASPTLVADFQANVNVGTGGSGKEQGLRAALLAVTDRIQDGTNAGLLRPGARLAIVIVSDEDDCSDPFTPPASPAVIYPQNGDACHTQAEQDRLPKVQTFLDALRGPLAGEQRDLTVAVIAGVDPVTKQPVATLACNPAGYGAFRYTTFAAGVKAGGGQALVDDVCQADFSGTLDALAGLIASQTVPLSQTPADYRLLSVSVTRASPAATACNGKVPVLDTDAGASTADVVYTPPREGRPAALTFQRGCTLSQGDDIHVQVLCAG